jgi:hypothetical protein
MKKGLFILILISLCTFIARPALAADNKAVVGSWKCSVTDVPYEYTSSVITISEKDGKLIGSVKFENGTVNNMNTVKFNNSQLILSLYVDGYEILVDGKVAGTKITGTVDTPDGKVNFTASRVEKK